MKLFEINLDYFFNVLKVYILIGVHTIPYIKFYVNTIIQLTRYNYNPLNYLSYLPKIIQNKFLEHEIIDF